jgi:hypothetical protein
MFDGMVAERRMCRKATPAHPRGNAIADRTRSRQNNRQGGQQCQTEQSNATNTLVQESVRAFYTGWYKELVTELPRIVDGYVYPMTGPGLGTKLLPDIAERPDAHVRRSTF